MSRPEHADHTEWLTRKEVMRLLSVSKGTIRAYERRGILKRFQILTSRLVRYRRRDVLKVLRQKTNGR
jgi:DNA-binding transcriptional MerR regulator